MTIDFSLLDPCFAHNIQSLINDCKNEGYNLIPQCGYRSLEEQARIWRRSRSTQKVNEEINALQSQGCDYLASVLEKVGTQKTAAWGTNAIPGLSWHNWGHAVDFLWKMDNGIINEDGESEGYKILGQKAISLGLRWGGWFSKADWGHVQSDQKEIPQIYSLKEVNDHFAANQ